MVMIGLLIGILSAARRMRAADMREVFSFARLTLGGEFRSDAVNVTADQIASAFRSNETSCRVLFDGGVGLFRGSVTILAA
jgi:hypothetical protein